MSYNPRKWTSFVIFADYKTLKKVLKELKPVIETFDHYNFNYYIFGGWEDHISIRVYGKGKEYLEEKIIDLYGRFTLGGWMAQSYDYHGRRAYEFGTRCAFLFMDMKRYFQYDGRLKFGFLFEGIHGLLDNIGIPEKAETLLYRKLWWHFAVRKPYYRFKRKIKKLFKR